MSQPELLKFALNRRIKNLGLKRKLDGGKVMAFWAQVVGPTVAERAQADSFSKGILTVAVTDATWRHQLSLTREDLMARLNEVLESRVVKEIFFVAVSRRRDR